MIADVLDRLLHRRSYRALFLEDPAKLGLSPEDADALGAIDGDELVATADAVRRDLMCRNHRGSGSLGELYSKTIGDLDRDGLFADFMESEEFEAYREIPFAGMGLSLEDAFHRYCDARAIGDPEARAHEHCSAMVKALLFSPRADFHVPAVIRRCPRGVFAIAGTTLYAALDDDFVTGELTPFLVDLLSQEDDVGSVAARHQVSGAALAASLEHLTELGLRG